MTRSVLSSFFAPSVLFTSSACGLFSFWESCFSIRFWRLSSFSSRPFPLRSSLVGSLSSFAGSCRCAGNAASASATACPTANASPDTLESSAADSFFSGCFIGMIFPEPLLPAAAPWLRLTATPSFWISLGATALYFSFSSSLATVTSNLVPLKRLMMPFALIALTFISTMPSPSSFLALSSASSFVFP